MRGRLLPVLAMLLAALVAVTACSSGPSEPPPPPSFDPPVGFAPSTGRLFGGTGSSVFGRSGDPDDLPVALAGTSLWTVDGGKLRRADSVGAATEVPLPPGATAVGRPWASPDGTQVLAAAAATVPGSGTTPPGLAAELLVVDPNAPAVAATVPATLPWNDRAAGVRATVVATTDGLAVLAVRTGAQRTTVGVDVAARRVLWTANGVDAAALLPGADPVVVGTSTPPGQTTTYTPSSVVGLDVRTGAKRFGIFEGADAVRGPAVAVAGPGLAVVVGREARRGSVLGSPSSLRFVRADGGVVRTQDLGGSLTAAPLRCVWDQAATTVCTDRARVFAVDATTAAPLWTLPDPAANRVAPTVTTAWHGAVYGTTVNGPLVLDGRTGADRDTRPGAAPALVDPYLAVSVDTTGPVGVGSAVAIHPAVR